MPELPEVETIVRQLDKSLRGKEVSGLKVLRKKSFSGSKKELVGRKVGKVWRRSKIIVMNFVPTQGRGSGIGWDKVMVVHLKMTGQLVLVEGKKRVVGGHPTADWVNELPSKHTRVVLSFKDGSRLFFNDMRVFGWMRIISEKKWKKESSMMPPDVVDKEFSISMFKEVVSGSRRAIKLVLMDQKKMGGVGNIYACDGLFLAGIDPKKPASSLSDKEVRLLRKTIIKVISKGVVVGMRDMALQAKKPVQYRQRDGQFLVYGRKGEKCDRCKGEIQKFKLGGRGTYWCPSCQE